MQSCFQQVAANWSMYLLQCLSQHVNIFVLLYMIIQMSVSKPSLFFCYRTDLQTTTTLDGKFHQTLPLV